MKEVNRTRTCAERIDREWARRREDLQMLLAEYHNELTEEQHATIIDFFEETRGCGYDWIGMLLSQFLPCRIKHRDRWYCSEWIAYALRIACIIDWKIIKIYSRKDLSPGVLYAIVQRINEEEAKEI